MPLYRKIVDKRKVNYLAISIIGFGLVNLYSALFPAIKSQGASYAQLIQSMPKGMLTAFGIHSLNFFSYASFISTEYLSFTWPILALLLLIGFSAQMFAGEIENRTIGLVLSLPISRTQIFLEKYLAGLTQIFIFVVISILSIIPLTTLENITIEKGAFVTLSILCILFMIGVYSMSFLLSSLCSSKGQVYMLSAGIFLLMYVLNIVAGLMNSLDTLKYFSFFYYFNPADVLSDNHILLRSIVVFIGVSVFCTICALFRFITRDIEV